MGPVLGLATTSETEWGIRVLVVREQDAAPAQLRWSAGGPTQTCQPLFTYVFNSREVVVFQIPVPLQADAHRVDYTVTGDSPRAFTVPATGQNPRFAYTSCNGFSSAKVMKSVADKNERWRKVAEEHAKAPFQVLLMGGDQVYADSLWEVVGEIKAWLEKPLKRRIAAGFTASMQAKVERFYFDLYCSRWAQEEVREMLAAIPTVMMWDDHDIFDGWGSYEPEMQQCPVYQGIYAEARKHFCLFQTKSDPRQSDPAEAFTTFRQFGNIGLAALDMRSHRTQESVMGQPTWTALIDWLNRLKDCKHLIVMSGIPVVYPDFALIESVLGFLPGQQELEDDLRDHWRSRSHRMERLRLIHRLLDWSAESQCRITVLSGDVHVGAVGYIESTRGGTGANTNVITQLVSSGIVHPAPPGIAMFFLKSIGDEVEQVDRGITSQMTDFPGTKERFLPARNWLSLTPDSQDRLWADWHVEGVSVPYTKVIHPG